MFQEFAGYTCQRDRSIVVGLLPTKANPEDSELAENAGISKRQIALLMHIAGDEANDIFAQLEVLDGKSKENLIDVLDMFGTYCNPRKNELSFGPCHSLISSLLVVI